MEVFYTSKNSHRPAVFVNGSITPFIQVGMFEPAESWAKRRYQAHFATKLTDAESENSDAETQLDFAYDCGTYRNIRD
jgi:hypothetical protein